MHGGESLARRRDAEAFVSRMRAENKNHRLDAFFQPPRETIRSSWTWKIFQTLRIALERNGPWYKKKERIAVLSREDAYFTIVRVSKRRFIDLKGRPFRTAWRVVVQEEARKFSPKARSKLDIYFSGWSRDTLAIYSYDGCVTGGALETTVVNKRKKKW